jgi:hypothetical protein
MIAMMMLAGALSFCCHTAEPLPLPEALADQPVRVSGPPAGSVTLAGVDWHLTGKAIPIRAKKNTVPNRRRGVWAQSVPFERKAVKLHFLHTEWPGPTIESYRGQVLVSIETGYDRPDYPLVSVYELCCDDGSMVDATVRWQGGIKSSARRAFHPATRFIQQMPWADIAWQGTFDYEDDELEVVYAMHFPNPYPHRTIDRIRAWGNFRDWGSAQLLGISTSSDPPTGEVRYVSPRGDDATPRPSMRGHRAHPMTPTAHAQIQERPFAR